MIAGTPLTLADPIRGLSPLKLEWVPLIRRRCCQFKSTTLAHFTPLPHAGLFNSLNSIAPSKSAQICAPTYKSKFVIAAVSLSVTLAMRTASFSSDHLWFQPKSGRGLPTKFGIAIHFPDKAARRHLPKPGNHHSTINFQDTSKKSRNRIGHGLR